PEVLDVVEQRVVCRSPQCLVHLQGGRRERVAHDLRREDVDGHQPSRRRSRFPSRSVFAVQPGGTTTVVAHSSTIAGPEADAKVSRSWTWVSSPPCASKNTWRTPRAAAPWDVAASDTDGRLMCPT